MATKWIVALLGITMGCIFIDQEWTPLIRYTPNENFDASYTHIKNLNEREFVRAVFGTFESTNPGVEFLDVEVDARPSTSEISSHNKEFDRVLKKINVKKCRIKEIIIPSKYANIEAVDRKFFVFDLENCS